MGRISIQNVTEEVTVTVGASEIARTRAALQLLEEGYPPVLYVPRGDVTMGRLARSDHTSHCPFKGDAAYFDFSSGDVCVEAVAWSYEQPITAVGAIAGHLAFYSDKCIMQRG